MSASKRKIESGFSMSTDKSFTKFHDSKDLEAFPSSGNTTMPQKIKQIGKLIDVQDRFGPGCSSRFMLPSASTIWIIRSEDNREENKSSFEIPASPSSLSHATKGRIKPPRQGIKTTCGKQVSAPEICAIHSKHLKKKDTTTEKSKLNEVEEPLKRKNSVHERCKLFESSATIQKHVRSFDNVQVKAAKGVSSLRERFEKLSSN